MTGSQNLHPGVQGVDGHAPGAGGAVLAQRLRRCLVEHARVSWPEEACGLLLGRNGRVEDLVWLRNRSSNPRQYYELDPLEYMHAERQSEQRGLSVLGIWHSHPASAAAPSATDERDAWAGWLYVIVGMPRNHVPDVRGWRLENGRLRQVILNVGQGE